MADVTVKQHDYYPPLRFRLEDEDGPMPLVSATTIKLLLVGPVTITGSVDAIDPVDSDGMNASYSWQPGQTATAGSYRGEIEITWSTISSPQAVETVPNSGTFNLVIEGDLG